MSSGKTRGGSEPDRKDARRERQARELRENLLRRKEQSRARVARDQKPAEPAADDGNGA